MTRNSKHPLGPSSLSNILFSYEEPLLETQPSTNVPLLPGSLVFERIVPKGTFKGAVENHDLVQVHFERLHRKNPVSSDTVGIRKVSNSIGNLSVTGQEIKPNSIPTSDNEISCSIASKMAKSDVEIRSSNEKSQDLAPSCNNCAPKADALGSFIHYLRELEDFLALDASLPMKSNLSQQSPDQNLLEGFSNENQESKTPVSHGNYFKESNDKIMDGKTSSGELVGHDVRKSSSQSSPNTESESQAMEREDLNDHSTNNPPHFLSPRHYNNIISSSFPLPCKDTTAQDDQDDQDSRGCLTRMFHCLKTFLASLCFNLWILGRAKPSIRKFIPKHVNTPLDGVYNLIPRYGKRGNILPNQPPCPAKSDRKPHEYELRLSAYFRRLKSPPMMIQNGKSICEYRNRPPRVPAKSRKTVFHKRPTPHKKSEINLRKCLSKSSLKSWRVRKSRVKFNRKSHAEVSGNGIFGYRNRRIKFMQLSRPRAKLSTFTNNKFNTNSVFRFSPSSNSDIKVEFCNYSPIDWSAENDGCPKKKFTLSRRATNEPLTDRAKGIMDADRPDSFKRLFSTIRVQNENPEKSDARKRRRREIIKDDISDCDLAGMGEPKKIVRLHRQELMNELNAEESIAKGGMREVMNKLKSEESITEERVKELMSIGRFKGYADILGTEITESETTKRVSLEVDGLNSDEMEIDEPSENSCTTKSKGKASEFLVRPELTRRQPMQFSGGVAMVRSGAESKKGTMKTLSQDLSVPDLRRLQQRVSEIREFITNKPSVSGDMGSSMLREMKRQLQQIRDQVVSTKPPATDDDRQRAARIIRQIEAENKVQNKSGNDSSIDLCGWYYHDEYETDTELLVVDMAIEEVSSEIRLIPKGDKRRKFKQARLDRLESRRALIEDKDIFYEDSSCDDLEFNEDDFLGKNEPDVPSKKYEQLNDEYRNAIASWGPEPTDATNEDPDLLHAIKLSLGQGEFVEAMNEGIDHAVPTPSNKTWKDGVESEKDQIEHAIEVSIEKEINTYPQHLKSELLAVEIPSEKFPNEQVDEDANIQREIKLSLNQRQHFEPKKQGTGRAETLSWPGTWGNDVDSEEEQLKRVIAISLATARGEDLEDEDYYMR